MNNNWQRMGHYAGMPNYNLGALAVPPSFSPPQRDPGPPPQRNFASMGQIMGGGVNPSMLAQPKPEQYDTGGKTKGKTILGMPKDQFVALMGTIAQAMAPDTAAGRLGSGLVNMSKLMRDERLGENVAQAKEMQSRREAAAKNRQAAQARKEKVPSAWEAIYGDLGGKVNPKTGRPYTAAEKYAVFKKTGAQRPAIPAGKEGFNEVNGKLHKGFWHIDSNKGEYVFAPIREATRPEVEKYIGGGKPPTLAERRAERKEIRDLETTVRGANPKTGKTNIEYDESQIYVDEFNELSDKSYLLRRVPGTPKEEKSFLGIDALRPDIPATPATLEKVSLSQFKTPESIKDADWLSRKAKRRLLLKKFPELFSDSY